MTSPTCDVCGERPLLKFDLAGRRFHFCGPCGNEMDPYVWDTEQWQDFINWLDSPEEMAS